MAKFDAIFAGPYLSLFWQIAVCLIRLKYFLVLWAVFIMMSSDFPPSLLAIASTQSNCTTCETEHFLSCKDGKVCLNLFRTQSQCLSHYTTF